MSGLLGALPRWTQGRGVDPPGARTKIRECRNDARRALAMLRRALASYSPEESHRWAVRAANARREMKMWIRFRRSGEFR